MNRLLKMMMGQFGCVHREKNDREIDIKNENIKLILENCKHMVKNLRGVED